VLELVILYILRERGKVLKVVIIEECYNCVYKGRKCFTESGKHHVLVLAMV
jgi:hypothetical protein